MTTARDAMPGLYQLPSPEKLGEMAIRIGITLVVAFIVQRALFFAAGQFIRLVTHDDVHDRHSASRAKTLRLTMRNLITVIVVVAAAIHVLDIIGWDVKALLAGVGVIGLGISFGAQTLVKDWIAGTFILIDDQYSIGDLVEVNGKAATVEEVNLRFTQLRDFNGYLYFVPNGEMRIVTNRSRGWQRLAVDVPISADQDLDTAMSVCRRVADETNEDPEYKDRLLDPVEVWGVESLGPNEATIRIVVRGRPGNDVPDVARMLRLRVHHGLMQAGLDTTASRSIVISPVAADATNRPAASS